MNCGAIAEAVQVELGIPCLAGMNEEAPAVDIYRQKIYILKTAGSARRLRDAVKSMTDLGRKLITGKRIGSAQTEGYFKRNPWFKKLSTCWPSQVKKATSKQSNTVTK